ncbi:MAG: LamG-like jellyroll fold domain-containing protein [Planctomycetota bacterium]
MDMRCVAAVCLAVFGCVEALGQTIRRVPEEFATIGEAVGASLNGDVVLVGPGVYGPVLITNGSFMNTEIVIRSTDGAEATIIDGGGVSRAIGNSGFLRSFELEGFTVRNGFASNITFPWGGGLRISTASGPETVTIRDCVFENNQARDGGGVWVQTGSVVIERCVFRGNRALGDDNFAFGSGGAVHATYDSGDSRITDSVFVGNRVSAPEIFTPAAAIFARDPSPAGGPLKLLVDGCVFWDHGAPDYSAIDLSSIDLFAFNSVFGGEPEGGYLDKRLGGNATFERCNLFPPLAVDVLTSAVITLGEGNISADPLFVAVGSGDFRLLPDSPCIDAGTGLSVGLRDRDLAGLPRTANDPGTPDTGEPNGEGAVPDMGAFEFQRDCDGDGLLDASRLEEPFPGASGRLMLDGINDHAIVPGFTAVPTGAVTVEFWAATPRWDRQTAFGWWDCATDNFVGVQLPWEDDTVIWQNGRFDAQPDATLRHSAPASRAREDVWTHWAFVRDPAAGTMSIFRDGRAVEVRSGLGTYAGNAVPLVIGDRGDPDVGCPGNPFRGLIDEFRVWEVARTENQIASTMSVPLVGDEAGLLAYYAFDDAGGTVALNLAIGSTEPDAELRSGARIEHPFALDADRDGVRDGCGCAGGIALDVAGVESFAGAGGSARFDGIDDLATSGAQSSLLVGRSFTVESWVYRGEPTGGQEYYFFHGTEQDNRGLHIGFRPTGQFTFAFFGNDLNTPLAIDPDGRWRHYACVYDADTNVRRVYVDGDLLASDTASADFVGTGLFRLGNRLNPRHFSGSVDEVRVWGVARDRADIRADMHRTFASGAVPADLLVYWPIETPDGSGLIRDRSVTGTPIDLAVRNGAAIDGLALDRDGDGVPDGCEACVADLNNDGAADFFDAGSLLGDLASGVSGADYNRDGSADGADVIELVGAISAGCP